MAVDGQRRRIDGRAAPGEITFKVSPPPGSAIEARFAASLDALARHTCSLARTLADAKQAAIKVWVADESHAHKFFTLCEEYAAFHDFRVDPKGIGLHGMKIPPGEVIRLTQAEVLTHPLFHGFAPFSDVHPPLRGWLATSLPGEDGRDYGLLQLSDKAGGRDFDEADETSILDLAALIGAMLDALRLAAEAAA